MKASKYFAVAVPVAAAGVLALAGTASASVSSSPTYTTAGTAAAAGWNIRSAGVDITHNEGRFGSSGDGSWENLPEGTPGSWITTAVTGSTIRNVTVPSSGPVVNPSGITGGIGAELCDTTQGSPGYTAQEGIVQATPGNFDVVEAVGYFGATSLNSSGDVCDNGLLGVAKGSTAIEVKVLLTGVKADDTVDLNELYNARTNYTVNAFGPNVPVTRGHVVFSAHDLMTGAIGFDDSIAGTFIAPDFITNEAAQGVVADTKAAPQLTGVTVPAPNGGALESSAPSELVRVAHSGASGNPIDGGRHVVHGSYFTNGAWTATPVASTADGTAGSALYLDPSAVAADNFYVAGGIGLVG